MEHEDEGLNFDELRARLWYDRLFGDLDLNDLTPKSIEAYYHERGKQIERGEPVIMVRNFNSESGMVFDYYIEGQHIGMVELEYGYGCDVYFSGRALNKEPLELPQAVDLLMSQFPFS